MSPGEKYTFTKQHLKTGDNWWRVSYLGQNFELISRFPDSSNEFTITIPENVSYLWISFPMNSNPKVEKGSTSTSYSPAPEDTVSQISSLSSQIKQTADGMTLLATKTELNTAKSDLQSGITTATNKANTAQSTANSAVTKANAAQSTANTNAQTISTHSTQISALNTGLSAKVSQIDFNTLSGRVTTAENNITAKANELSSKISTVEGKLEAIDQLNLIGAFNLTPQNATFDKTDYTLTSTTTTNTKDGFLQLQFFDNKNVVFTRFGLADKVGKFAKSFKITKAYEKFQIKINGNASDASVWCYDKDLIKLNTDYVLSGEVLSLSSDGRGNGGQIKHLKIQEGKMATGFSKSPEDVDSDISKVTSEIKQTTDAITASVSSVQTAASNAQSTANTAVSKADAAQTGVNTLDSTTVKSASLTINTDGIVMKAGKSTTDVANAIGSYFAVSQNAINLFADKINVKANMIVDGSITSNKIAAGAITADKIKAGSITADMFKGNQITSLNGATTLNLYTGEIIFNNQYATINQIKGSYKSQISLFSLDNGAVNESAWSSVNTLAFNSTKLTSATRRAGSAVDMFPNFSLMTLYGEKIAFTGETSGAPDSQNAIIVNTNSDEVSFINGMTNSSKGAWNYSMIMNFGTNAAISAPDIKLAGHIKSLTGILDDLCKKVGIMWI